LEHHRAVDADLIVHANVTHHAIVLPSRS
jgi:hypothetical protein